MVNYKDMTKEELIKALKEKEEENGYLAENISNKEIQITELKESFQKKLDAELNSLRKEKDNDLKINVDNLNAQLENLSQYTKRREDELSELVNLSNNIVICIDAFSAIAKYANNEIYKKITKEN